MAEEKKIQPIIKSGGVKTRKPSEVSKFTKLFLSDDAGDTNDYVLNSIIIPKVKDLITSVIKGAVDGLFYGSGYSSNNKSRSEYVSYRSYQDQPVGNKVSYKSTPMFEEIIFDNPKEAEEVCERMQEIVQKYKIATYGHLYDLVGIKPPYTAEHYGWTDFRNAKVVRTMDGYVIKTPQAMPVD